MRLYHLIKGLLEKHKGRVGIRYLYLNEIALDMCICYFVIYSDIARKSVKNNLKVVSTTTVKSKKTAEVKKVNNLFESNFYFI